LKRSEVNDERANQMQLKHQAHIVVVDSHPRDYRGLTMLVGEQGWHLHFLTSGRAALRFNTGNTVELWLINVTLPDLSGIELMQSLRGRNDARFFIVANSYEPRYEREACEQGADLFVCKDANNRLDCKAMLELFCRDPCPSEEPIGES
jgi:DNA-binding response OmpR family regulator